jgi:hypothetical protein
VREVGGELGLMAPEEIAPEEKDKTSLRSQVAGGGRRVEVMP